MALDQHTRAELERLGVELVRQILNQRSGYGRGADVRLDIQGVPNPDRGSVEDWIAEKDAKAESTASARHNQIIWWTRAATIAAFVAAVIAALGIWLQR